MLTLTNDGLRAAAYSLGEVDLPVTSPPAAPAARAPKDVPPSQPRAPAHLRRRLRALRRAQRRGPPAPVRRRRLPDPSRRARRPLVPDRHHVGVGEPPTTPTPTSSGSPTSAPAAATTTTTASFRTERSTGDSIDENAAIGAFAADGAYNALTKTFWRVDAVDEGSSCIFELDPAALAVTGNRICPETGTSERGLAYDATTDTYYIGSWNDGAVKHFSSSGELLDSAVVNETISGLAYNPTTRHLFALLNLADQGHNVVVYDAAQRLRPDRRLPDHRRQRRRRPDRRLPRGPRFRL